MNLDLLLDGFVDSCGRVVAEAKKDFRSEARAVTAEFRAEFIQIKSDLKDALGSIEKRFSDLAANIKDGSPGEPGTPGKDGKDADIEEIAQRLIPEVERAVASLPKPVDGRDGKDAEPPSKELLAEVVSKCIPSFLLDESGTLVQVSANGEVKSLGRLRGKDGSDGLPGQPGERGADAPDLSIVPDDIAIKMAAAVRMLAEKPVLETRSDNSPSVVVNMPEAKKHIKTWRDEEGNLHANVEHA